MTPEQMALILAKVQEKVGRTAILCVICGQKNWQVEQIGIVPLIGQSDPMNVMRFGGPMLPVVAMSCTSCGNTLLINLIWLGLGEEFGLRRTDTASPTSPSPETPFPENWRGWLDGIDL